MLQGDAPLKVILGVLFIKSAIWIVSLGSGTSGGVLAPLLMMGAALGGIGGRILPHFGAGFWPLVSMGAILGGTMRSPLTGIVFAIELTHDLNVLLPLVVATFLAHGFTVLVLKRSILTEKVARRGFHLSREYATDPLELLFVREVMRTDDAETFQADVVPENSDSSTAPVAYANEPLRVVVYRMAETGWTRLPVLSSEQDRQTIGTVSLADLLRARTRHLEEERRRERVFRVRLPLRGQRSTVTAGNTDVDAS